MARSRFRIRRISVRQIRSVGIAGLVACLCALAAGIEALPAARALYLGTIVVEVLAFLGARRVRRSFDPDDPGRRTWTLITAFLGLRILAELRLATIYLDWIPQFITASAQLEFFYVKVLRYLYTLSDLLFVGAVLVTMKATRSLGLGLRPERRDFVLLGVIAPFPIVAFLLQGSLQVDEIGDDASLLAYRLVAVSLGTVIAGLCVAIYGIVRQMGGGILARVWGGVAVAGIARAASFVALAVVALVSAGASQLAEQSLLWVFACAWWTATREQERLAAAAARVELD